MKVSEITYFLADDGLHYVNASNMPAPDKLSYLANLANELLEGKPNGSTVTVRLEVPIVTEPSLLDQWNNQSSK